MKDKGLRKLVLLAQQKDEGAFNELYRRYHKLVHYIAYQLTRSDADADDVAQETFLQVQRSLGTLKDPNLFKAWIGRITYSKAMKLHKKHQDVILTDAQFDHFDSKQDDREDMMPHKLMRHTSDMEVLHMCIHNLKYSYREVLVLYYFAQLNIKEITETLKIPEGTVKSRLLYGKKYLREEIEKYEKRSGEKLTFHGKSMEAILISSSATIGGKAVGSSFLPFKHITIPTSSIMMTLKIGAVMACTGGVVWGGYTLYETMKQEPKQTLVANEKNTEDQSFPSVMYHDIEINTARMAYQTLLEWAHCEAEMEHKSQAEFIEISPLYENLEAYGGVYQQLLQRNAWSDSFNQYYDNK